MTCRYCNGTGKVPLATSVVDCDCRRAPSGLDYKVTVGVRFFGTHKELLEAVQAGQVLEGLWMGESCKRPGRREWRWFGPPPPENRNPSDEELIK